MSFGIRLHTGNNRTALTFDDGPDPKITPALLDLLDRHGIPATFFMMGEKAAQYSDLVTLVAARGHLVAAHGHSHRQLLFRKKKTIGVEVEACNRVLTHATGKFPKYFRPPYGRFGPGLLKILAKTRQELVLWSGSIRDFDDRATPQIIAERLKETVRQGAIVLLHDGHRNSEKMLVGLQLFLERCRHRHRFGTLERS